MILSYFSMFKKIKASKDYFKFIVLHCLGIMHDKNIYILMNSISKGKESYENLPG